jgi:hypothetical protein
MIIAKNFNHDEEIQNYNYISIDTEWTKNYKIKNGNKPFNFSIIYFNDINIEDIKKERLVFKFVSIYIEKDEEIPTLIKMFNDMISPSKFRLLIGHQIISDLHTFKNYSRLYNNIDISNINEWIKYFKDRKINNKIFDTRFDIENRLKNKSRRLVDVCEEFKIKNQLDLYKQPELKKSMTFLHNYFIKSGDSSIREKLSVLNLRHNLSVLLVYQLYMNKSKFRKYINSNKILYKNLHSIFEYIKSKAFKELTTLS